MATLDDIPITYFNETARYDYSVVVFCQSDPETWQRPVAWQMLRTQTSAHFTYPAGIQVGAEWTLDGVDYRNGPFDTKFGSTWNLIQTEEDGTPQLIQGPSAPTYGRLENTDDAVIVIKNVQPELWSGRPYNFGLYKAGRRVIALPQVGVSACASLSLTTVLIFGIVPNTDNLAAGDIIESVHAIQYKTDVDIADYSSGLTMTLNYDSACGKYTFTAFSTPVFKLEHPHIY